MSDNDIWTLYEHPLNERVRVLLRLEHLFRQMLHFHQGSSPWDSRMMITTLFDVLNLFSRADLKTEIIKEVERANNSFAALIENPHVDTSRLSTVLKALRHITNNLHAMTGQIGQSLRDNPFLTSIRQRSSIPGGTCEFDLPSYHLWLQHPLEIRHRDQGAWLKELEPINQAVELLLKLIRNSSEITPCRADNGQYQQSLESDRPYQLIRVFLPQHIDYFPEVSGSRHRFTIRFIGIKGEGPISHAQPTSFRLAICML
ncbi:MAG: cell division protein ZapD [Gammaproteobacteria bacterium]|nr:cell division protein ZapD [Gammaproteobacteria bacterium]